MSSPRDNTVITGQNIQIVSPNHIKEFSEQFSKIFLGVTQNERVLNECDHQE